MEIEAGNGRKLTLNPNISTIFGRGNKLVPDDRTISRRHIIFELNSQHSEPPRVSFEVTGRNPIWVKRESEQSDYEQREIKVFRRFERGELGANDMFCLSGRDPVWFKVKRVEEEQGNGREEKRKNGGKGKELDESLEMGSGFDLDGELEYESVDVADIDPVKEFGFLVIGHEFDQYPKQMIRDIKAWDWFIDDPGEGNTDEEDGENTRKRRLRKKRKKSKGEDDDDEEWTTDEAGDEKEVIAKARKIRKAEYHTRSKDSGRSSKDTKSKKGLAGKKSVQVKEEEKDDDEEDDDETLGGFIVDKNVVDEEEEESEEEEEEEEFEDDEDDE